MCRRAVTDESGLVAHEVDDARQARLGPRPESQFRRREGLVRPLQLPLDALGQPREVVHAHPHRCQVAGRRWLDGAPGGRQDHGKERSGDDEDRPPHAAHPGQGAVVVERPVEI